LAAFPDLAASPCFAGAVCCCPPPVRTPVTPVTTPTTPPIAPPSTPPTGPAALLPSRAPFWTPSTTCASTIPGAFKSIMAATPRAAHSFSRARSFDVGLVICLVSMVGLDGALGVRRSRRPGTCRRIRFYRLHGAQVYRPRLIAPMTKTAPDKRVRHTVKEPAALSHTPSLHG